MSQVEYLAGYLESLGAASLLIESHYIDRHFIEEVGLYYSRRLLPTGNSCARLHVFRPLSRRGLLHSPGMLNRVLGRAARGRKAAVSAELNAAYLGYIVVRPLPSVPIGRTVLVPPADAEAGSLLATADYTVHVLGFELRLKGLAFQQQDQAVGACATTAIWTALQQACKREGERPPTPSSITEAAVRYSLPWGRPLPSSGLTIGQICEALRHFEHPPEVLGVGEDPEDILEFTMWLNAYIRSGMPAILALDMDSGTDGHAITLVGCKSVAPRSVYAVRKKSAADKIDIEITEAAEVENETHRVRLVNLAYDHVYVHDDRLGPYVLAPLVKEDDRLFVELGWPGGSVEQLQIFLAAIPLYPKLRSAARELFESVMGLLPAISELFSEPEDDLAAEFFFDRSGKYLGDLYDMPVDPAKIAQFFRKIALSRYVGVIRWTLNGEFLLDMIWDTTDRLRETRYEEHFLGIVSFRRVDRQKVDWLGHCFGIVVG